MEFNQVMLFAKLNTGRLPWCLSGKESACSEGATRDMGLIPGSGRSPGGGNGNALQCSCLENPMDRGAWWATVHGVTKNWTWLSECMCVHTRIYTEDATCQGAARPVHYNYGACVLEPRNCNYWARVPQLLKPTLPRAGARQQATAVRSLCMAGEEPLTCCN